MTECRTRTEECVWTKENLKKLLAQIERSVSKRDRVTAYHRVLKGVNWKKVAFPPFSPEACKEKWEVISLKMRKLRSLTELITEAEEVISDPSRNPKIHPEYPEKPACPNLIFCKENLAKYKELHPNISSREAFKAVTDMYSSLSVEQKARYVEKSLLSKLEHKEKMVEFRKQYHSTSPSKRRRMEASGASDEDEGRKEGLPPKPPCHGYALFCKEQKANMAGVPKKNKYVAVWAKHWRELTEEQRSEYGARCKELQRQYTAKVDALSKMSPDEPKMPPRSGYELFFKKEMSLLKEKVLVPSERLTRVTQLWQKLSMKEKEKYKEELSVITQEYSVKLQNWFKELTPAKRQNYLKSNANKSKFLGDLMRDEAEVSVYVSADSEEEEMESSSDDDE